MNNGQLQLALREWRRHLTHPLTFSALAGVTLVLTLVGPFDTNETLSAPERLTYWALLTGLGYVAGYLISYGILRSKTSPLQHVARVTVAGISVGVAMCGLVLTLNRLYFGRAAWPDSMPAFLTTIIAISLVVMVLIDTFSRHFARQSESNTQINDPPALLSRLPFDKRGPLVAISVEDHYVRVRTTKGEEMILLRLSDAMREVGETRGAQVHRSHWAAFDQVRSVTRKGDRAILSMRHGDDIPVSRANIAKIKEVGLLP